jgi:mannose/fructose/N-acetylgalactosamine-specific phosphotransferase system component IIC
MYTIIAIDPDVPLPTVGTPERPILHGLVTNIVNGNLKEGIILIIPEFF